MDLNATSNCYSPFEFMTWSHLATLICFKMGDSVRNWKFKLIIHHYYDLTGKQCEGTPDKKPSPPLSICRSRNVDDLPKGYCKIKVIALNVFKQLNSGTQQSSLRLNK